MDVNMIITDANEALCRMVGKVKEEIIGKSPFDFGANEFKQFFPQTSKPKQLMSIEASKEH